MPGDAGGSPLLTRESPELAPRNDTAETAGLLSEDRDTSQNPASRIFQLESPERPELDADKACVLGLNVEGYEGSACHPGSSSAIDIKAECLASSTAVEMKPESLASVAALEDKVESPASSMDLDIKKEGLALSSSLDIKLGVLESVAPASAAEQTPGRPSAPAQPPPTLAAAPGTAGGSTVVYVVPPPARRQRVRSRSGGAGAASEAGGRRGARGSRGRPAKCDMGLGYMWVDQCGPYSVVYQVGRPSTAAASTSTAPASTSAAPSAASSGFSPKGPAPGRPMSCTLWSHSCARLE